MRADALNDIREAIRGDDADRGADVTVGEVQALLDEVDRLRGKVAAAPPRACLQCGADLFITTACGSCGSTRVAGSPSAGTER